MERPPLHRAVGFLPVAYRLTRHTWPLLARWPRCPRAEHEEDRGPPRRTDDQTCTWSMPSWPREYYKNRGGRKEDDDRIVCLCDGVAGDDAASWGAVNFAGQRSGRCDFCQRKQRWCREVQILNRGC
jgi:hypothetical protein